MKKDIYIIKNSINNKVYIGQSANVAKRWLHHVYDARYEKKKGKSVAILHDAMSQYGYDKFHYEIIESQVENYDEREAYWIKQYNSLEPNGYNTSPGNSGFGDSVDNSLSSIRDTETLMKIISEISSSGKTFSNIAKKYNVCEEVISAINNGYRYKIDDIEYPIRNMRYSSDLLKQVRYSLKYELDITLSEISKKYNIDLSQLSLINNGRIYFVKGEDYPIRKKRKTDLDNCVVDRIIDDIKNSDLTLSEIAIKYKISRVRVSGINNGKIYIRSDIDYPIRSLDDCRNGKRRNFIDIDTVRRIHELLRAGTSTSDISNMFQISTTTVQQINNGKEKRYRIDGIKYPIRDNRNH